MVIQEDQAEVAWSRMGTLYTYVGSFKAPLQSVLANRVCSSNPTTTILVMSHTIVHVIPLLTDNEVHDRLLLTTEVILVSKSRDVTSPSF